jgi:hypothetical protein
MVGLIYLERYILKGASTSIISHELAGVEAVYTGYNFRRLRNPRDALDVDVELDACDAMLS